MIRYPAAGNANADVSLLRWTEDEGLIEIEWDKDQFPYLAAVRWKQTAPTLIVQDRQQREIAVVLADPSTGTTVPVYTRRDPAWIDLMPGLPTWSQAGEVIDISSCETRELWLGDRRISKVGLEVRKFIGETTEKFVYLASDRSTSIQVWASDGVTHTKLSVVEGVFDATVGGSTVAIFGETTETPPLRAEVVNIMTGARNTLASNAMNPHH